LGYKKEFMKLSIEMEAEDWLDLCKLHHDVMEVMTPNMGVDPLAYSSAANLTNTIQNQVFAKIPLAELNRIKEKRAAERM
jgi:hypothetical protein